MWFVPIISDDVVCGTMLLDDILNQGTVNGHTYNVNIVNVTEPVKDTARLSVIR